MTRRARLPATAAAAAVHVLLLLAPLAAAGRLRQAADPRILLFLVAASAWCLLEGTAQPKRRKAAPAGRLPPAIGLSLLVVFWLSLFERGLGGGSPNVIASAAGALLMGTGIALRLAAIRTLGSYFLDEIALYPGQPLVTDGIYGRLRHPSEAGTLAVAFGGALLLASLGGLLAGACLLLPLVRLRVRLEDDLLRRRHGEVFSCYGRQVPALVPRRRTA